MIFHDYLSGMGRDLIVKKLVENKIPSLCGGQWWPHNISVILRNECYVGDLRLQKTFISDHLQKKKQKNRGELPQYLVTDAHEAIIDRETFEAAQRLTEVRIAHYHPSSDTPLRYPFSGMLHILYKLIVISCSKKSG